MFTGYTAGSHYTHTGGGSNYICLHSQPEWGRYTDGFHNYGNIYGTEYQIYTNNPFKSQNKLFMKMMLRVLHVTPLKVQPS